jgi:hypothetical protein
MGETHQLVTFLCRVQLIILFFTNRNCREKRQNKGGRAKGKIKRVDTV